MPAHFYLALHCSQQQNFLYPIEGTESGFKSTEAKKEYHCQYYAYHAPIWGLLLFWVLFLTDQLFCVLCHSQTGNSSVLFIYLWTGHLTDRIRILFSSLDWFILLLLLIFQTCHLSAVVSVVFTCQLQNHPFYPNCCNVLVLYHLTEIVCFSRHWRCLIPFVPIDIQMVAAPRLHK